MVRVALISDTHGYLDPRALRHLNECDEIWHAGDVGKIELLETLEKLKKLRAVSGNIDGGKVRAALKEMLVFNCEDVKVVMIHIGGYPGRYAPGVKELLKREKPQLFISGHSHILKVINDRALDVLHMNPGALGKQGIHRVQTMLLFNIDKSNISDLRVVEFNRIAATG